MGKTKKTTYKGGKNRYVILIDLFRRDYPDEYDEVYIRSYTAAQMCEVLRTNFLTEYEAVVQKSKLTG